MPMEAEDEIPSGDGGPPTVIVLGNEKGGTGKSTTAIHLAVGLLYRGLKVGTLDLDLRQATLTRYLHNRQQFATSWRRARRSRATSTRTWHEARSAPRSTNCMAAMWLSSIPRAIRPPCRVPATKRPIS